MKKYIRKHKWSIFFWTVLIALYLIFSQVIMTGYVSSESMRPTLEVGDFTLSLRIFNEDNLKVGDIITFKHKTQSGQTEMFVKRIAAVSGDTVLIGDEEVTLQDGEFYVLGDNSASSWDSRYWDEPFVQSEDIKGKIIYYKAREKNE